MWGMETLCQEIGQIFGQTLNFAIISIVAVAFVYLISQMFDN